MPDFLLEIGCEEIPARMIDGACAALRLNIWEILGSKQIPARDEKGKIVQPEAIPSFSTPRRLAIFVEGLPERQPDKVERVNGPSTKVAFKDGKPTQAAEAFAKKVGKTVSDLETVHTEKGEYISASVETPGRLLTEILVEELPKALGQINWPKNMYWRAGKPERFVRPVRWIVALLDGEIVRLEFGGIKAGRMTRGHRILSSGELSIAQAGEYDTALVKGFVAASYGEREQGIRKALDAATRAVPGARWREDPELLNTVVNLTEWPSAILGNFDPQFLSLPEEVLVTVMRDHQKYFAVEDATSKLAPHFLAILNTDGDPDGLIRHGNERVLRARFNDAQFFWNVDNRTSFVERREMLKQVTFQKDLGNYYEKSSRIVRLISWLRVGLDKSGAKVDGAAVTKAAELAKNDLTTELVKEFTELQGIVGGLYAKHQGLHQAVADAIYDQYKPTSMEDSVPRTIEGAVLSIADKADSIAGMFSLGLIPSGSKDPFSLRRQANGIVKTIAELKLPITIATLMKYARAHYATSEAERKFTLGGAAYDQTVSTFFRERLEFYLRDALGLAYDVVNATLAADANDVVDAVARATAVAKVRPSSDFESIATSFKRMKNILRQARDGNKKIAESVTPASLNEDEEKALAKAIPQVAKVVNTLRAKGDYEGALIEISQLRPAIDSFFDKVMVMVDDEALRANRLGLLQTLVDEFSRIADFSEIVTGKEAISK
jgi:glycyl-tRNA synthetase beta chain